jgi:hypothetical protein
VSNIIKRLMDNIKLLLICILRVLLSQYLFSMYVVLFLFNNVIYVFLLYDCMFIYDYPDWGFSRAFSSAVRQMPGWYPQRRGTARTLPNFLLLYAFFVLFYVFFELFYLLFILWRSLYYLCVYVYWTTATGWLPNCS